MRIYRPRSAPVICGRSPRNYRYPALRSRREPLLRRLRRGWPNHLIPGIPDILRRVVRLAPEERKSNAGRKPFDAVLMFKVLVLQTLYNLSDEQVEYQIRDHISLMRFLGLGLKDAVPDATTVWLVREALAKAGLVKTLFERFNRHLDAKGYIARGGQIIDATIIGAPKQRNTREENEAIKAGQTPEGWKDKPAKKAQKDGDAPWTKKHGKSYYGYKNHA